jgi:hypothetical protein
MKNAKMNSYTAFEDKKLLVQGDLKDVVLNIKQHLGRADHGSVLIFSDATGKTMDFNFRGSKDEVLRRLEPFMSLEDKPQASGPGRPKLGVVSREVSLLPRHWEWLATQPGGASSTLRLLIEEARKKSSGHESVKQVQERVYQVMRVLAGDLEDYEEALRALYKRDRKKFQMQIQNWPADIKKYLNELASSVLYT